MVDELTSLPALADWSASSFLSPRKSSTCHQPQLSNSDFQFCIKVPGQTIKVLGYQASWIDQSSILLKFRSWACTPWLLCFQRCYYRKQRQSLSKMVDQH